MVVYSPGFQLLYVPSTAVVVIGQHLGGDMTVMSLLCIQQPWQLAQSTR